MYHTCVSSTYEYAPIVIRREIELDGGGEGVYTAK